MLIFFINFPTGCFLKKLFFIGVQLIYNVVFQVCSQMIQLYTHIYLFSYKFISHLCFYRLLSSVKVKEEREKVGLKFNTQKTKIMASGPITSWQIDGETVEWLTLFIYLFGSKITADGDCRHETKRCLLLGAKL